MNALETGQLAILTKVNQILDAARRRAARRDELRGTRGVSNRIDEMTPVIGYAEPGYGCYDTIIVLGNWNDIQSRGGHVIDKSPSELASAFEAVGADLQWSDEWSMCDDCQRAIRIHADGWCWKPSYWLDDGGHMQCHECALEDPSDLFDWLENNPHRALTLPIDPSEHGFQLLARDIETGMHPGQNGSPSAIAFELESLDWTPFIFKLDRSEQFTAFWSVWAHDDIDVDIDHLPESLQSAIDLG